MDLDFIQALASQTPGYTLPAPYVLWLLGRYHSKYSAVVEEAGGKPLAYMLAIPVDTEPPAVFVWQFACTFRGQRLKAPDALTTHLKQITERNGIHRLIFTAVPKTPQEHFVKNLCQRIFAASPMRRKRLPRQISDNEFEYILKLKN
jgi:hypothetical protein